MSFFIYFINVILLFLCFRSQSKIELVILIYILLYYVVYSIAHYNNIHIDVSHTNDTEENNFVFILVSYLFLIGYLFQFFLRKKEVLDSKFVFSAEKSIYILDVLIVLLLLYELSLTQFNLLKGVYGNDTKFTYFFEYINILFAIYAVTLRGIFNKKLVAFILIHITLALFDGHRMMAISSIMMLALWYLYYIPKRLIPIVMIFFISAFLVFGLMRVGLEVDLISLLGVRGDSFNNHHGSLIYSCLSIIDFSQATDLYLRFIMSTEYTLSLFGSPYWLPEDLKFTTNMSEYTYRPGGGMLPVFFYSFFGYFGALFSGILISYFLSFGRQLDQRKLVPAFALVALALMPHYFSYTPILIFKAVLATLIFELFILFVPKSKIIY